MTLSDILDTGALPEDHVELIAFAAEQKAAMEAAQKSAQDQAAWLATAKAEVDALKTQLAMIKTDVESLKASTPK